MEKPVDSTVYTLNFNGKDLCVDAYEVLRYLGYKKEYIKESDLGMVKELTEKVRDSFSPRACYGRFAIALKEEGKIDMPYGSIVSHNLSFNLSGCQEIYMFAATLGPRFDMAMNRARLLSISEAAVMQAIGAAAVEEICDRVNELLNNESLAHREKLRPRYSPGFGDFGLDNQPGIFDILNPERHIGLTLRDTKIMSPEKSVTAVIGIEYEKRENENGNS